MNVYQNINSLALVIFTMTSLSCKTKEVIHVSDKEGFKEIIPESQLITCIAPIQYPSFPGGQEARIKFITKHLDYPKDFHVGIEGRVYVQFLVTKSGKVKKVQIVKGLNKKLDNEALKVVKQFPDFIPAQIDGKPVSRRMIIPIYFK